MGEAEWCAYCGHLNIATKTIERPESYVKRFDEYIHVCPLCIEKHKLVDVPEYNPSELQKFVNNIKRDAIVPSILTDEEGTEYLVFHNGQGTLLNTKEMKFIANELSKTIKLTSLDEFIEKENKHNYMSMMFLRDQETIGKYLVPIENLNIKRKKFNSYKNWGCTCGNCSKKMSSKDGGEYFSISPSMTFKNKTERACSEGCIKVIAKERVFDWLNSNKYQIYFDLDKLNKMLTKHIQEA